MEVDTNSQIIQLVESRPILYTKCNDYRERADQWKELSDILRVDVSWVKSRWHLLRAKFLTEYSSELKGNRTSFKYYNDMSFLANHVDLRAFDMISKQNELEFVIDNKDLEEDSDNDSVNVFMELDLEEHKDSEQQLDSVDLTEGINENEDDEPLLYEINEDYSPNTDEDKQKEQETKSAVESFQIVEIREEEDPVTVKVKENNTKRNVSIESKPSPDKPKGHEEITEKVLRESPTVKAKSNESEQVQTVNPEKHRCEDTIFGELVTATLLRMPVEKKKAVKREIMNLLFT